MYFIKKVNKIVFYLFRIRENQKRIGLIPMNFSSPFGYLFSRLERIFHKNQIFSACILLRK